ncbi:hypothetical protein LTR70_003316, partial [Exophiala xenobiotica]
VARTPYKIQKNRKKQWEDVEELYPTEKRLDFAETSRKDSENPVHIFPIEPYATRRVLARQSRYSGTAAGSFGEMLHDSIVRYQ